MANVVVSSYCSAWVEVFGGVRDELVGAASLVAIEGRIGGLEALGYSYVSKYEAALPLRRYFVKAPADGLRIHVHGVERGRACGGSIWLFGMRFGLMKNCACGTRS